MELKPEELEKVSGGSSHFPHFSGTYWYCSQCIFEIFFPDGTSEEEKQKRIDEHMKSAHSTQ